MTEGDILWELGHHVQSLNFPYQISTVVTFIQSTHDVIQPGPWENG